MSRAMNSNDLFPSLATSHPVSFILNNGHLSCFDSAQPNLCQSPYTTNNPAVPLINGNVECTSCHNPHVEKNDPNGDFW